MLCLSRSWAAEEVRQQERALGFTFDHIIVCTVTSSTQCGVGRLRSGLRWERLARGWRQAQD
jgi:1-aminocyclopropane-1-carboxylate deaminase/D-cysteine desulfhydrase-like pyridoxal-dependent ACC family enzyme